MYLFESGDYNVIIDANDHEGSYSLDWSAILFVSTSEATNPPTQSEVAAQTTPRRTITNFMLLSGKETTAYPDFSDKEITLLDSTPAGQIITVAKYAKVMPVDAPVGNAE